MLLVSPFPAYSHISFNEHVDLSTEDSMLEKEYESHNDIHMPIEASFSNVKSDERLSEKAVTKMKTKKSLDL